MNFQPLKYIYQPSGDATAYTLLLLHGTGGDERDLLPLAKEFGPGINILSLRGNVLEGGMPRFFKRLGMGVFDEQDLLFRTHELVAFVQELAVKEKFDAGKVIALGYSNGANIAGSTLIIHPDFLAGAILYRPMQPFKIIGGGVTNNKVPVFMSNGNADPTIDPADTQRYVDILQNAGFRVTNYNLPAGHGLTKKDVDLSVEWYEQRFINSL
ncbi:MAG TPA: alpha/beta hydrolase [Puia sp.]|jgi:phospholipase/carboxylesterase|nr:alpha/beta hydrolase [Puia sp.]